MKIFKVYQSVFFFGGLALGFIVVGIYLAGFFMGQINDVNAQKATVDSDMSVLNDRLNVLQAIDSSSQVKVQTALNALPTDNNSLALVSQVRSVSDEKGVTLKNLDLTTDTVVDSSVSGVLLSFDVEGDPKNIVDFVTTLEHSTPLMTLQSINLQTTQVGQLATAILNVHTQWAPLPEKLPAITEAISGLSTAQQDLLTELSQFRQPILITSTESGEATGRSNPFSPAQ